MTDLSHLPRRAPASGRRPSGGATGGSAVLAIRRRATLIRAVRREGTTWQDASTRKPVLLTVDDDPAVSRSVARDLRRRYGDAYRVVRADSGPLALDALRELRLRGDQVAVLLADHRMPGMTGIEFLEQAMDIYPQARRVLLTAYADTDVAIDAVNVVDLDHYLLKPWDPPEEKFYPVLDAQLEAWTAHPPKSVPETKVVGPPVVRAVVGGPRVPGPQPGAVPLVRQRQPRGPRPARRRRRRRHDAARRRHHGGRRARRAHRR